MLPRAERGFDDGLALGRQTQVFLRKKIHKSPFGASVRCVCHAGSIKPTEPSSQSATGSDILDSFHRSISRCVSQCAQKSRKRLESEVFPPFGPSAGRSSTKARGGLRLARQLVRMVVVSTYTRSPRPACNSCPAGVIIKDVPGMD